MDQRNELIAAYGNVAMLLSNVDFLVGSILELLIDPQALMGSLVVDRMPFERRIQQTRTLAKFRFVKWPDVFDRAFDLMQRADSIRRLRNQFIHGFWEHSRAAEGILSCCDPNWDFKKSIRKGAPLQAGRMQSTAWTLDKFNEFAKQIGELIHDLLRFCKDLETKKLPMITVAAPKQQT